MLIQAEEHDDETFLTISLSRREWDLLKLGEDVSKSRIYEGKRCTFFIKAPPLGTMYEKKDTITKESE
jgi:hypothetical protein